MLLAGMATRTFCATASPTPEKPIQKKAASVTPYRRTNFSVACLGSVFIPYPRVLFFLSQLGKLAKSMETESCCQLKFFRCKQSLCLEGQKRSGLWTRIPSTMPRQLTQRRKDFLAPELDHFGIIGPRGRPIATRVNSS